MTTMEAKEFESYSEVRVVVIAHLYDFLGKIGKICAVCEKHGALIIEEAAKSMGATFKGQQTGSFGDYARSLIMETRLAWC